MTLAIGQRYDLSTMSLIGWTRGDGSSSDGYDLWSYFDARDCYLGPDAHGIEPIVTI